MLTVSNARTHTPTHTSCGETEAFVEKCVVLVLFTETLEYSSKCTITHNALTEKTQTFISFSYKMCAGLCKGSPCCALCSLQAKLLLCSSGGEEKGKLPDRGFPEHSSELQGVGW